MKIGKKNLVWEDLSESLSLPIRTLIRVNFTLVFSLLLALPSLATTANKAKASTEVKTKTQTKKIEKNPTVKMVTSYGDITLELFQDKAPITVENFKKYIKSGFYKGTVFHRVIDGFMIQGGGLDEAMIKKQTLKPIKNEATNKISNQVGTIAMARTSDPHSATSQFFINVTDNSRLDHQNTTARGFGYCVFGKVVKGMTVVNQIKKVKTGVKSSRRDVPLKPVLIKSIEILKG